MRYDSSFQWPNGHIEYVHTLTSFLTQVVFLLKYNMGFWWHVGDRIWVYTHIQMTWWPCKPNGVCSLICTQRAFHAQDGHVTNTFLDSHVSHVLQERRPHEVVYVCSNRSQWQSTHQCISPSVLFVVPLACDWWTHH